jgi:hypothetical protein
VISANAAWRSLVAATDLPEPLASPASNLMLAVLGAGGGHGDRGRRNACPPHRTVAPATFPARSALMRARTVFLRQGSRRNPRSITKAQEALIRDTGMWVLADAG